MTFAISRTKVFFKSKCHKVGSNGYYTDMQSDKSSQDPSGPTDPTAIKRAWLKTFEWKSRVSTKRSILGESVSSDNVLSGLSCNCSLHCTEFISRYGCRRRCGSRLLLFLHSFCLSSLHWLFAMASQQLGLVCHPQFVKVIRCRRVDWVICSLCICGYSHLRFFGS